MCLSVQRVKFNDLISNRNRDITDERHSTGVRHSFINGVLIWRKHITVDANSGPSFSQISFIITERLFPGILITRGST